MKKYFLGLLTLALCLSVSQSSMAQMTIDELETTKQEEVKFRDSVRQASIANDYFSLARYRAERAAIRKERNTLEIIASLQGSLTSFNEPWVATSGGDNTTAVLGSFVVNHSFKKDKFTVVSKVNANLGFNRVKIDVGTDDDGEPISEGVWFKNQDQIAISIAPTMAISSIWSYGTTLGFRTQFANGYVSRSQQEGYHLKSGFMAPGYLDISGGMTYTSPDKKLPFVVSIAPVALSAVYVSDSAIQENFLYNFTDHEGGTWKYVEPYGVSPVSKSKYEGGSSIQINFDRTFEQLSNIRYTTSIFSFYGWMTQSTYGNIVEDYDEYVAALGEWNESGQSGLKPMLGIRPTVRWENTIAIPATKYLSTTIKFQMYYNKAQDIRIQTQTYLSVGLSYTFKNK